MEMPDASKRQSDVAASPTGTQRAVWPIRSSHAPFVLVLAGGGARGLAHAGVLRGLNHYGYQPTTIVGISMGAIIGAAYALNPDWYKAVLTAEAPEVIQMRSETQATAWGQIREVAASEMALHSLVFGWGLGTGTVEKFRALLRQLTLDRSLEEGTPTLSVITTDLLSGRCIVISTGDASAAVYASSALAGLLPPLEQGGFLLADGGYADLPPLRSFAEAPTEAIIMVDPDRNSEPWAPKNGFQAMIRAAEVAMQGHARRFARDADLVLCPRFRTQIGALEFGQRRSAQAAGVHAVRQSLDDIRKLLRRP